MIALQVNYKFSDAELDHFDADRFSNNVLHTLEEILKEKHYDQFIIVAKSIGTIALSHLTNQPSFKKATAIWLTPLLHRDDVYQVMLQGEKNALCIIGDKDFCYKEDRFANLKSNSNMKTLLIPNGDHSLENKEDVLGSLDMLKTVITGIIKFPY
ncbi:hypothetical protein [Bacillus sp. LL01]|uniref:hypothetical protein n=1 Tax=Bacillus sp. LL01 TaxID=1665556 RepID=UPI00069E8427|nr:hypothetical protein [Bacillus sp. LL01]